MRAMIFEPPLGFVAQRPVTRRIGAPRRRLAYRLRRRRQAVVPHVPTLAALEPAGFLGVANVRDVESRAVRASADGSPGGVAVAHLTEIVKAGRNGRPRAKRSQRAQAVFACDSSPRGRGRCCSRQARAAALLFTCSPPSWLSRPGDDDRAGIVVLVANLVLGAASILSHRKALFHQLPRPAQLLSRQVRPRRTGFPLPLEIFQSLAALLIRAPHAPRRSAWHPDAHLQDRCHERGLTGRQKISVPTGRLYAVRQARRETSPRRCPLRAGIRRDR